jgi:hypothetical protein
MLEINFICIVLKFHAWESLWMKWDVFLYNKILFTLWKICNKFLELSMKFM